MIMELPGNVTQQGQSPLFSAETLPAALQTWHKTAVGVWAKIVVTAGSALYEIDTDPREAIQLSPQQDGIIEPQRPHRLTPSADAEIQVFFYREDA